MRMELCHRFAPAVSFAPTSDCVRCGSPADNGNCLRIALDPRDVIGDFRFSFVEESRVDAAMSATDEVARVCAAVVC
jgi:hypothetical protein